MFCIFVDFIYLIIEVCRGQREIRVSSIYKIKGIISKIDIISVA